MGIEVVRLKRGPIPPPRVPGPVSLVHVEQPADEPVFIVVLAHEHFPDWTFHLSFNFESVVSALAIKRAEPEAHGPGVTAQLLRKMPLGEVEAAGRRELDRLLGFLVGNNPVAQPLIGLFASRPGRRGRPDVDYAAVAAAYVEELRVPSQSPVKAVAERLGYSSSTVRNVLHEARRRELLTPTMPGRSGGSLTEKARRLLEQEGT